VKYYDPRDYAANDREALEQMLTDAEDKGRNSRAHTQMANNIIAIAERSAFSSSVGFYIRERDFNMLRLGYFERHAMALRNMIALLDNAKVTA
jgi:hypothetical protein